MSDESRKEQFARLMTTVGRMHAAAAQGDFQTALVLARESLAQVHQLQVARDTEFLQTCSSELSALINLFSESGSLEPGHPSQIH